MDIEERPVHTVVDCSTGETTHTPLTDGQWSEHRRRAAEHAAAQKAQAAADAELAQTAAAHPDPLVQALARRAGILL
jgi:hypothetical protein